MEVIQRGSGIVDRSGSRVRTIHVGGVDGIGADQTIGNIDVHDGKISRRCQKNHENDGMDRAESRHASDRAGHGSD